MKTEASKLLKKEASKGSGLTPRNGETEADRKQPLTFLSLYQYSQPEIGRLVHASPYLEILVRS